MLRPTLHSRRLRPVHGFTLLEVLLVLAIIVVMASLAVGVFSGAQKTANINKAKSDVSELSKAAGMYKFNTNQWPGNWAELKDNVSGVNNWAGPYIKMDSFIDPWGNEYQLAGPDQYDSTMIVKSLGDGTGEISSMNP